MIWEPGFYTTDPQCRVRSVPCPWGAALLTTGAPSFCSVPWTSPFQQQETCPQLPTRWGPDSSLPPQLYESALTENQKLKTKLQEAQLELADVKSKLEKMAQVRRGEENQAWVRQRGGQDGPPQRREVVFTCHGSLLGRWEAAWRPGGKSFESAREAQVETRAGCWFCPRMGSESRDGNAGPEQ